MHAFASGLTSACTRLRKHVVWLSVQGVIGDNNPSYRYQRDVETFFRHSPAVHREGS